MKQPTQRGFCAAGTAALLLAVLGMPVMPAAAQDGKVRGTTQPGRAEAHKEERQDAATHLDKAAQAVKAMRKDAQVDKLLQQAKGVFIIPQYGRAALGVGAQGGAGVLVAHHGGKWSAPGFYNFGGVSMGLQAGVEAGSIAMLLMTDKALNMFNNNGNKFALTADAGLTIVDYSARATGTAGQGDVVLWSNAKGVLADLNVGVTDINFDEKETRVYYGKPVSAQDIVSGKATSTKAKELADALSS